MAFGAFAPMPIRLGGTAEEGWTAAEHARLCADMVAMTATAKLAEWSYSTSGGGNATVIGYNSMLKCGTGNAPASAGLTTGSTIWNLDTEWQDPFGFSWPVDIKKVVLSCGSASTPLTATYTLSGGGPNQVIVEIWNADTGARAEGTVTIKVYGTRTTGAPAPRVANHFATVNPPGAPLWSYNRRIGHYGGAIDKEDSGTEGTTPYAWTFYQLIQGSRGTAYTTDSATFVHAETLAWARSEMARFRAAERMRMNSLPGRSTEKLGYWATVLGLVVRDGDVPQEVRQRAAAKYRLGKGNDQITLDAALEEMLGLSTNGGAFVRTWNVEGTDLANPPALTMWPGVNPGPAGYALSARGAWLSERAHITVEVVQPAGMSDPDFLELMNVHLFRMLDDTLPSTATFDWAMTVSDGFLLDIDQLDFDGL